MCACADEKKKKTHLVCRWALKSCVHVYILCESIRDLYFPLSYHSSRGKVETTVSVCTVILTEKAGLGKQWENCWHDEFGSKPCLQVVCVYLWRGGVFCFPCPLYCKISNTGMCMWACACMQCLAPIRVWCLGILETGRSTSPCLARASTCLLTHTHTHMHMTLQIHMSQSCKNPIQFRFVQIWLLERDFLWIRFVVFHQVDQ